MNRDIREYVSSYLDLGLSIIPVEYKTKKPIGGKEWNKQWTRDKCIRAFQISPGNNIGLLTGDVVDVEGDTPEANRLIDELIGDCPHPTFYSSKSKHHLFLTPDPNLTRVCANGVEFRGKYVHSVLPPSVHKDGTRYRWDGDLLGMFPVPPMPEKLVCLYEEIRLKSKGQRKTKKQKPQSRQSPNHKSALPYWLQHDSKWLKLNFDVKPGHCKKRCPCCNTVVHMSRKRFIRETEAMRLMGGVWHCQNCREVDLRPLIRSMRSGCRLP